MATRLPTLRVIEGQLTTAEVNAGKTVVAPATGRQLAVVDAWVRAIGGAAGANTSVDIVDTTTGTVAVSFARAGLAQNAVLRAGASNTTATNLNTALGAGEGLKVINVGTAMSTATALDYVISYTVDIVP
jgi:hypothetical protein